MFFEKVLGKQLWFKEEFAKRQISYKYSDEKESHQNEIAHTLVLLVVEALEEKIIPSSISTLVQGDQPRLMDEEVRCWPDFK